MYEKLEEAFCNIQVMFSISSSRFESLETLFYKRSYSTLSNISRKSSLSSDSILFFILFILWYFALAIDIFMLYI